MDKGKVISKRILIAFGIAVIAFYGRGVALAVGYDGMAGYLGITAAGAVLAGFAVPMLEPEFYNGQ